VLLLPEGVGVAATRESLCVTFMPTNKIEIFEQVSKLPFPFSFFLSPVATKN